MRAVTGCGMTAIRPRVVHRRCRQGRPAREPLSDEVPASLEDDAAVALMMAIARAIVEDENQAGLNRFLCDPIAF